MKHNVELLVTKARQANAKPVPEKVDSERDGKALITELESHCNAIGFEEFSDIEADDNNRFCKQSRHAYRLVGGRHKVWISLRLFITNDGQYRVWIQVQ